MCTQPQKITLEFRHNYYEAVDVVIAELERRFDRSSSSQVVVMEIEQLLLDAANGKQIDEIPTSVKTLYKTDLDMPRLHAQLGILRDVVRVSQLCSDRTITIGLSSIISVMSQASDTVQQMFDQVITMVQPYLSIPVSTATAERTFSVLRRLKTYLRTDMSQKRLNNALLLHVHKDYTDKLDMIKIANDFVQSNERRRRYFDIFREFD